MPSTTVTRQEFAIMKRLSQTLVIASIVALPLVSHIAHAAPTALDPQVRTELLAEARGSGYPRSTARYSDIASDVEIDYASPRGSSASDDTSYGPSSAGSSASSKRVITIDTGSDRHPNLGNLYSHP
jgi:hypothetical protein